MKKHLVVISVDALVYEDLLHTEHLPHFRKLMENGAWMQKLHTIYPSLTHPIHVSIVAGAPAGITKVPANTVFVPGKGSGRWYNDLDQVACDTIFHEAHAAGLTVAACCWPLTARAHGVIDYLMPELLREDLDYRPDEPLERFRRIGTGENILPIIADGMEKFGGCKGDGFEIYCAARILKEFRPDLLFTHPCLVDDERHRTGVFSPDVSRAVEKIDGYIGQMMDAAEEAGIADCTDFVVLSDHGHMPVSRIICPNVYFADAGLLKTDEAGNITSWDAFAFSCALSCHVYLSRPEDSALYERVYSMLKKMAEDRIYGFDRVFTKEEVRSQYGLDGDFSFVLETDGLSAFSESCLRPIVRDLETNYSDYRTAHSSHGHLPEKGPQPTFLGMGPSFRPGARKEREDILNVGPTLAKLMGLQLKDATGHPVEEILR